MQDSMRKRNGGNSSALGRSTSRSIVAGSKCPFARPLTVTSGCFLSKRTTGSGFASIPHPMDRPERDSISSDTPAPVRWRWRHPDMRWRTSTPRVPMSRRRAKPPLGTGCRTLPSDTWSTTRPSSPHERSAAAATTTPSCSIHPLTGTRRGAKHGGWSVTYGRCWEDCLRLIDPDQFRILLTGHSPQVDELDAVRFFQQSRSLRGGGSSTRLHIESGRSQLKGRLRPLAGRRFLCSCFSS